MINFKLLIACLVVFTASLLAEETSPIEERNKNLILRLYDERDTSRIDDYFKNPLHLQDLSTGQDETVTSIKQFDVKWAKAFTQTGLTVHEMVAGKDHVAVYWTWHAIHNLDEWQGIAITNKEVHVSGLTLYQIEDDRIASIIQSCDNLQLFEYLKH